MSLDLSLVPKGMISHVLPAVIPYLEISEKWARGRALVDDLIEFVVTGQMQLWIVLDESRIYGHVITEVKHYPRCKMFIVQYCAMNPHTLEKVEDKMQELAERYAKGSGCAGIEFIGRPGWARSMKKHGYDVRSVMFQKFFGE